MKKNIELNNPWVLDLTKKYPNSYGDTNPENIKKNNEFFAALGYGHTQYDGIKRWGWDSTTDSSDITYDEIEEGMEMWMRKFNGMRFSWVIIRVTHKYNGIIFFETLSEKKNKKSYIDTGADDYVFNTDSGARYKLPEHTFYPIEVIKPTSLDIAPWKAPKHMIITNI